jgi:integrase
VEKHESSLFATKVRPSVEALDLVLLETPEAMSTTHSTPKNGVGQGTATVRHSKDDALDTRSFEHLVEATYGMDDYYGLQCRFLLFVCGRLGLRRGELAHLTEDWIDWRNNMIVVPRHDPCTNGRENGVCGYCRQLADQKAGVATENALEDAYADLAQARAAELEPGGGRVYDAMVSADEKIARSWSPKTENAAREIPFDATTRAAIVVERFFERFDEWPGSAQSVNRRVNRVAEACEHVDGGDVYPHALRATAATFWSAQGLDVFALKSMLGWADLSTARCYISTNGERTAQAIRDTNVA